MAAPPPLTVILPVRNAADSVDDALASLAAQRDADFAVLAVDDGSSDGSRERLEAWRGRVPGLELLARPARGLTPTLNEALERTRSPLVARMDADDVAHPDRLARQRALLEARPELTLIGCHVRVVARDGAPGPGMLRYARWIAGVREPDDVLRERFVECPIVHPTFCFRRDAVLAAGGYRAGPFPEDYELVLRLAAGGAQLANLPEPLLDWYDSPGRLSRTDAAYDWGAFLRLKARYLARHLGSRAALVWGVGKVGRFLSRELLSHGVELAGFVDVDPRTWGRTVRGRPVHPPEHVEGPRAELVIGAVGTLGAREEIRGALVARGLVETRDFLMAA